MAGKSDLKAFKIWSFLQKNLKSALCSLHKESFQPWANTYRIVREFEMLAGKLR